MYHRMHRNFVYNTRIGGSQAISGTVMDGIPSTIENENSSVLCVHVRKIVYTQDTMYLGYVFCT